jgi:hypothetical protein
VTGTISSGNSGRGTGSGTEHQTPSVTGAEATSTTPKIESLSTPVVVVVVVGGSTARHQIQMMVKHWIRINQKQIHRLQTKENMEMLMIIRT